MATMDKCTAQLTDDRLTLSTGRLVYAFRWNEGHLVGESLADDTAGVRWELGGDAPDCEFPEQPAEPRDGQLEVTVAPATPIRPAHVRAAVTTCLGDLQVRRVFRLYADCPAIGCDLFLRGRAAASWRDAVAEAAALANVEDDSAARQGALQAMIMHRLWLPHHHVDVRAVQFFDITDRRNTLVTTQDMEPYRAETRLAGNILLCRDRLADRGVVLLKEAPCSDVQLAWPGCDFVSRANELQVVGAGVMPGDLDEEAWLACYGYAVGVGASDEHDLLAALRCYQDNLRVRATGRDNMIMLNTWGDRGQDKKMSEAFVGAELRAGKRLGVTHFQLDHGWETCHDPDETWPPGLRNMWDSPHFWHVHPTRFPNGLGPCVAAARKAGIELCLWFNPSEENSYAHWRDDAGVLIGFYREHGIRTFKIDGVQIPDKAAELNLRRMLDTVMEATGQQAVFNLDVTAGRRFGYHYFTEYGNKFVENRYTDWSNYYPHWALRNLWMLSRYMPAQWLQIEFLNKWRNPGNYGADDPLAPRNVPFDYCFALTMMAQPLAWFEASELPEEAFAAARLVRAYCKHQERMHAGQVFPVGEEPCGVGWTGFQSVREDGGYLLMLREWNERASARISCHGLAGRRVRFRRVAGSGRGFTRKVAADAAVEFALPEPFSFGLYEYGAV